MSGTPETLSRVDRLRSAASSAISVSLHARKHLWIGPALTAVLIVAVGWWTHRSVEHAAKMNLAEQLQTLLKADVAALELWLSAQFTAAQGLSADARVSEPAAQLAQAVAAAEGSNPTAVLLSSASLNELRRHLSPWMASHQVNGFVLVSPDSLILASDLDIGIGDASIAQPFAERLAPVFQGETVLLPPFKSKLARPDKSGSPQAGLPVMFVVAAVLDEQEQPIAALGLRIRPEDEFTKILGVARAGESGETYAFNRDGVFITSSRFDDQLKRCGLLPDDEQTGSVLNLQIRDPGVDLTQGRQAAARRSEQPPTRMVRAALEGRGGVDVDGYRDYRGVPVVGAWLWLPRYGIGVATEVDVAEALAPLKSLRRAFGALAGLLVLITLGMCALTYHASQLDLKARQAAVEAKQLGQYTLGEKIGEGGMGVVYRAHHKMLHRPTAVKLLHVEKSTETALARFEREVQLTSQLTHPNTIAIYDYGRTPEGVFYYAMELLDGISLEDLIATFGPQPAGRVIYILRQLCDSLFEAHQQDLIHRDVKPGNIMVNRYGGQCDFVKLLDFGLVKSQHAERNTTLAGSLTGTPLYMAPEAIRHEALDARSDLYAVGGVAYFLLTGSAVFDGQSIVDICKAHLHESPVLPADRLGRPLDEDLQRIVLTCLAKDRQDRPADAAVLEQQLAQCRSADAWTRADALAWWNESLNHERMTATTAAGVTLEDTVVAPPSQDMDGGGQ